MQTKEFSFEQSRFYSKVETKLHDSIIGLSRKNVSVLILNRYFLEGLSLRVVNHLIIFSYIFSFNVCRWPLFQITKRSLSLRTACKDKNSIFACDGGHRALNFSPFGSYKAQDYNKLLGPWGGEISNVLTLRPEPIYFRIHGWLFSEIIPGILNLPQHVIQWVTL